MPPLRPAQLDRTLRDRVAGGAFFFHGDEDFLREDAASRVVAAYLDPATRDFNFDQVRGADVAAEDLASVIGTPPMMAEHRVVVVRDAQGLSVKAREVVEAAAKAPPQGLILVLSAVIPSASKAKFYDDLKKHAVSIEFAPLSHDDAPGWAMETAREELGYELEPDAARALVGGVGVDLGTLTSELKKLAAYAQERKRVTLEDVRAVGGAIPRQDRWEWFDLIAERRFREAVAALPVMLDQGENGVGLVIGMGGVMLRIGLVCAGGPAALERELKPFQKWMARRVGPQARKWTLPEVDRAMEELLRTDRLLKSASLSDRQAIEELLLRLWAIERPARAA
ncbi:DNA polymerase III subunit delta [Longimicrobium terrae]|uniref:DNA polymerase III subunit delta n=1 Tax=Longimicrobium terrae TaxID=1639882 RepID=A0A841H3D0_9BACT|nr:DNA polymerase-3 subunit delta [Longimicrobium terrae]MBB6072705.1 DNA polymerase-3 subunit delta [Longimicrobium terrae]NNC32421.1 DNA polymerase III subunit delta [Longimicrobium terrae]